MRTRMIVCLLSLVFVSAASANDQTSSKGYDPESWPQWRGPDRSNVSPSKTKLLDKWPEGGPKRLWVSDKLPGGSPIIKGRPWGGCGSVVVAEGKAYIYGHFMKEKKEGILITADFLENGIGWVEGVPQDLFEKVEAIVGKCRKTRGDARKKRIDGFIASLEPKQSKKFEGYIRNRFSKNIPHVKWETLQAVVKVLGKRFGSHKEFSSVTGLHFRNHGPYGWLADLLRWHSKIITDTVVCFDAKTGKKLWISEFPGGNGGRAGFNGSSTPAIAKGKCYFTGSAGTYCIDANTGNVIWKVKSLFTNSSPMVQDNLVYANYPDGFRAFDAETGTLKWHNKDVGCHLSSVVPWSSGGQPNLVVNGRSLNGRGSLICVEAKTGKTLWTNNGGAGTPAIGKNMAVTFGASVLGNDLTGQGNSKWKTKRIFQDHGASAAIFDGYVYIVGGGAYRSRTAGAHCYDLKTGELKWTEPTHPKFRVGADSSSVVIADGKAFGKLQGRAGVKVIMFKASPEKFELLGLIDSKDIKEHALNPYSSPTIAGGKMYIRYNNAVACYDLTK